MADEAKLVVKELRERNDSELQTLLNGKRADLHQVKFKQALGQLRETHQIKQLKRDIARIQTVLNEREQAEA